MRNYDFSKMLASIAIIGAMGVVSSCSSDDGDGNGSAPDGPTAVYDGNLLTKAGNYTFAYDEKGRCVSIKEYGDKLYSFDYESGTITMDDDFDTPYNVSFTRDGYISRIWAKMNEKVEGMSVKLNGETTFDYDSSGHFISGSSSFEITVSGQGMSYSEKDESEAKLTWNNGNLTNVALKESGYDDEDEYDSTTTVEISYSNTPNEFKQWTFAQEGASMATECLGLAGLMGIGTADLINSYTENYIEAGNRTETHTYSVSYQTNSIGLISQERLNGSSYNYSYTAFDDESAGSRANMNGIERDIPQYDFLLKFHRKFKQLRAKHTQAD